MVFHVSHFSGYIVAWCKHWTFCEVPSQGNSQNPNKKKIKETSVPEKFDLLQFFVKKKSGTTVTNIDMPLATKFIQRITVHHKRPRDEILDLKSSVSNHFQAFD